MNDFFWVVFGLLGLYALWSFLEYYIGILRIEQNLFVPEAFSSFQNPSVLSEDFLQTQEKVDAFKSFLKKNKSCKLRITEQDLNNLQTKGIQPDKSIPGIYYMFKISGSLIVEDCLHWPSIPGVWSCDRRFRTFQFSSENSEVRIGGQILEQYGRDIRDTVSWQSLANSTLMQLILGNLSRPYHYILLGTEDKEYKEINDLLLKIDSIKIEENAIIISSSNQGGA